MTLFKPMTKTILGTQIHPTDYDQATKLIQAWAERSESRMVFFANVHMVMEACDAADFQQIVNAADLVTPDGMPLVWQLRRQGLPDQQRVSGYALTLRSLESAAAAGIPVGFLGGTPANLTGLLGRIKQRFPGLKIAYSYAPPFRDLSPEEDAALISAIQASGARILFVGLGCPKQERWMADHRGKIDTVMLGIGAAVEILGGTRTRAPRWMRRNGLEWVYRLFQEPKRLWKRYLFLNPRFIWLSLRSLRNDREK